jgi:hypothetical protein
MRRTQDRGEIVHFAGFHALSPALDTQGAPAFSAGAGDGLTRCGWETFFTAVERCRLALDFDPADGRSARFIPDTERRGEGALEGGLQTALAHSRRFWGAIFPKKAP